VTRLPRVNCNNYRNGLVIISSSADGLTGIASKQMHLAIIRFAENNCFKANPFGDNSLFETIIASKQIHLAIIHYSKK
jgi:hypothetical protein